MNESTVLNNLISDAIPNMHKTRANALFQVAETVVKGGALTVTEMGAGITSSNKVKHGIKKADRLLSNTHIQGEINGYYKHITHRFLSATKRPLIHIDWSDLDDHRSHYLLRASLAAKGRSVTLYHAVFSLDEKEKAKTHERFMSILKGFVPDGVVPIIVTDAGFKNPWFKLVESLGWDYVGRVRGETHCSQAAAETWHPVKSLYPSATRVAKELGSHTLAKSNPMETRLTLQKQLPQGRKDKTKDGQSTKQSSQSRKHAKREDEPWLLATSLDKSEYSASQVCKIYKTRMQIEESFKDLKTGVKYKLGNTRIKARLCVLMFIGAIAQMVLCFVGLAIVASNEHRQYQANSVKTRLVLSYQTTAQKAIRHGRIEITPDKLCLGLYMLMGIIRGHEI